MWSVQDGSEVLKVRDGRSWERVVWSPDGRLLALGARSPVEATARDVTLWDVRTGERVATLGSAGPEVAFSPEEYLAFPAWGGEVWLVALATGDVVLRRPAHPDGPAAFAPDGTLIARAPDGSLRAWQVPGASRCGRFREREDPASPSTPRGGSSPWPRGTTSPSACGT